MGRTDVHGSGGVGVTASEHAPLWAIGPSAGVPYEPRSTIAFSGQCPPTYLLFVRGSRPKGPVRFSVGDLWTRSAY